MCKIIRWMREERHEIKSYVGRGICMCILKTAYIPRFSEYMIQFSVPNVFAKAVSVIFLSCYLSISEMITFIRTGH